ncbi:hypothetical protein E2C01_044738 [Portunus trituberculatus]|uniref:Uncharacterized protein n=1 Tax=Portunus trituberculatus TaxID=210409 RepID=A0A5B7G338_PORTR|nr:hypothetical protein [Portunus trituberculatus]
MNRSSLSETEEAALLKLGDTTSSSKTEEAAQLVLAATTFSSALLTKSSVIMSLLASPGKTTYRCIPLLTLLLQHRPLSLWSTTVSSSIRGRQGEARESTHNTLPM